MKIRAIIITIIAIIICGYSGYEARNIARGPIIEVYEPVSGMTVTSEVVTLRGTVKNTSEFTINGRGGAVDDDGRFEEQIVLLEGRNTVKIQAEDRFKRNTERVIELMYEQTSEVVNSISNDRNI